MPKLPTYSRTKIKARCEHDSIINIHYLHNKKQQNKPLKINYLQALPWMNMWTLATTVNKQPASAGTLGGKGMLPAQHTTFNTLDNWAINPPPNQKGKGLERKGYRVMVWNMYTIHSVTSEWTNAILKHTGLRSLCSLHQLHSEITQNTRTE